MSFTALILVALALHNAFQGCEAFYENNPDLGKYQNVAQCFPSDGLIHFMYRNFEFDPYYGGKEKCVTVQQTAPLVDSTAILTVKYNEEEDPYTMTFYSSPGYNVKNMVEMVSRDNLRTSFNLSTVYTGCDNCFILRHNYIDGGAGCSYWARGNAVTQKNTCCQFVFDLLCNTFYKYEGYSDMCE